MLAVAAGKFPAFLSPRNRLIACVQVPSLAAVRTAFIILFCFAQFVLIGDSHGIYGAVHNDESFLFGIGLSDARTGLHFVQAFHVFVESSPFQIENG